MAKLVKTQVEMEGRFEERWVLVEPDDHIEAWPDSSELAVVGTSAPRVTGAKRVSGSARYISDIADGLAPQGGAILNSGDLIVTNVAFTNDNATNGAGGAIEGPRLGVGRSRHGNRA